MLFFGSDRPGGLGGFDIWFSERESIEAPWSAPTNFGPSINTPQRDNDAVFWPEGATFFFRSDGRGGLGGEDMFMARVIPEPSSVALLLSSAVLILLTSASPNQLV